MKKVISTLLMLWASSALKGLGSNQAGHMETARLKMSLMYVQSIKTFRLLFMSMLSMGMCLILFLAGLILLHVSLFLYAPWSVETKMMVGCFSAAAYILISFILFSQIFASDKWLEIFHAQDIMDQLEQEDTLTPEESVLR